MKPKKFNKKLALNKKTIVNLNHGQLGNMRGGFTLTPCTDETCRITVCASCETCDTCGNTCISALQRGICCVTLGENTCEVGCTEMGTVCGSQPCC
jgi:hypothetical protein